MAGSCSLRGAVVSAFMLGCALAATAQEFGGGTGEPNDPYLVYTPVQLGEIGQHPEVWYKHFKLMTDIDLSDYAGDSLSVIGTLHRPFGGVFDGNGHLISGFNLTSTARDGVGLFACVGSYAGDSGATVKNLGLVDPNVRVDGGFEVGALVGSLFRGRLVNCYVQGGEITSVGGGDVGGLVGVSAFGHIANCYATAAVSGNVSVGGLVGYSDSGTITTCYSAGPVVGNEDVGGW